MKNLTLVVTFLGIFLISKMVFSQYISAASAHVEVTQQSVVATITNRTHYNIVCSGRVFGIDSYGNYAYSYINNLVIPPRGYSVSYVRAGYTPFVTGDAEVNCRASYMSWNY